IVREGVAETPGVSEDGGGDAEANHIGQGIELHAELGVGAGHARDAPVHGIKENGDADGFCGVIETFGAADPGSNGGVVTAKKVGQGEHARDKKDAAAQTGPAALAFLKRYLVLFALTHGSSNQRPTATEYYAPRPEFSLF